MPIPEIGRIKIGEKKKNASGVEYPSSLDYFRATGEFAARFAQQYGPKPTKLTIVFVSDNIDMSCQERFEAWDNKGKRFGWGDGETFTVWNVKADNGKGAYVEVKAGDPLLATCKWDEMVTLRFVLPEMKGILGHWVFTTKGAKTIIPALVSSFDFVKERAGTVIGIPFEFIVEKVKGYSPGVARQYSKVKIVPCISEDYISKVKDYIGQGKKMSEIAPLMVTAMKLLGEPGAKLIDAPAVEFTEAVEIKDEKPPEKKEPPKSEMKISGTVGANLFPKEGEGK